MYSYMFEITARMFLQCKQKITKILKNNPKIEPPHVIKQTLRNSPLKNNLHFNLNLEIKIRTRAHPSITRLCVQINNNSTEHRSFVRGLRATVAHHPTLPMTQIFGWRPALAVIPWTSNVAMARPRTEASAEILHGQSLELERTWFGPSPHLDSGVIQGRERGVCAWRWWKKNPYVLRGMMRLRMNGAMFEVYLRVREWKPWKCW